MDVTTVADPKQLIWTLLEKVGVPATIIGFFLYTSWESNNLLMSQAKADREHVFKMQIERMDAAKEEAKANRDMFERQMIMLQERHDARMKPVVTALEENCRLCRETIDELKKSRKDAVK
jgi:xylose isomerase